MKKIIALCLAAALVFCLAGCAGEQNTENVSSQNTASQTSSKEDKMIKAGLWGVIDGEKVLGYYYFSENGVECSYHNADTKTGIPFDYEVKDDGYVFHLGAADDNTPATAVLKDGDLQLTMNGKTEILRYIGDMKYEDFNPDEGRGDVVN
ncbi:MAG: hypothetical protein KBS41_00225 [Oscillospiraceae bacterium]|nr:hypothetical protein [Candidatus Equicaccousia limihippi]